MSTFETNIPGLTINVGPNRVTAQIEGTLPAIMKTANGQPVSDTNPADVEVQAAETSSAQILIYAGSINERNVLAAWAKALEDNRNDTAAKAKADNDAAVATNATREKARSGSYTPPSDAQ